MPTVHHRPEPELARSRQAPAYHTYIADAAGCEDTSIYSAKSRELAAHYTAAIVSELAQKCKLVFRIHVGYNLYEANNLAPAVISTTLLRI